VILDTREAEIRRTVVQSQPRQIGLETLSRKNPSQKKKKKKTGEVAQSVDPEFKPQCRKRKRIRKIGGVEGRTLDQQKLKRCSSQGLGGAQWHSAGLVPTRPCAH
jgi:hypothetical protein